MVEFPTEHAAACSYIFPTFIKPNYNKSSVVPYKKHKQYRLPGYDYSAMGDYFITICTRNRIHYFGKIIKTEDDSIIEMNAIGSFVKDAMLAIPVIYKDVTIGETVVMPNHIHLIISLPFKEIVDNHQSPLKNIERYKGLQPLQHNSVSSIINHFKGGVKKWCNANGYSFFQWQSRYHDHIIRDSKSYNRISNYIINNVYHWGEDENNEDGNNFRKDVRI